MGSTEDDIDVPRVLDQVQCLLDESVAANHYVIHEQRSSYEAESSQTGGVDVNAIDWEKAAERFASGKKRTEVERIRAVVKAKVEELARLNPTRDEWMERLQQLIDEYNAGSLNVETMFQQLTLFTQQLSEEDKRHLAEGLTDDELAVYDLLTWAGPDPTAS